METATVRPRQRPVVDPVVALRHVETGATWTLPSRSPLTIGASDACDVCIRECGISARHAILERDGLGWRLHDVSKNGSYVAGTRVGSLEVAASRTFALAETPLTALAPMMAAATSTVEIYLGLDQPRAVSNLLVAAYRDDPVLIVGKPGAGQVELGRAIHAISTRRNQPLVDLSGPEAMKRWQMARGFSAATAIVALDEFAPAELIREVWAALAGGANWRWIIAAGSEASASTALRVPHLRSASLVALRSLDERTDDRAALVNRLLAQVAPVELASLPEVTQRLLTSSRAYASLAELREVVRRVGMVATGGINQHTASALGMDLEHLQLWAAKLGLAARR